MERAYWFSRKRASLGAARSASSSEARLVHYDLAGRYSVLAMSEASKAAERADGASVQADPVPSPIRAESADDA